MTDRKTVETTGKGAVSTGTKAADTVSTNVVVPTSVPAKKAEGFAEKIAASGLFMHEDQVNGRSWVGVAGDPCNTDHRCRHTPLAESEPRAGLEVHAGSNTFAIPSDFPRGLGAMGWLAVVDGGGKSLFA